MSLTNRLLLYFISALGAVLIGFSLSLYLLVQSHLYAQLDEHLQASMKTLLSAVEVHPHDVEWEPLERRVTIGEDATAGQPRWTLYDLSGQLRDRSMNLTSEPDSRDLDRYGWRVLARRMRAGNFTAEAIDGQEHIDSVDVLANSSVGNSSKMPLPIDRTFISDGLIFTVVVSKAPIVAMLQWLAFTLIAVSAVILLTSALWGYWLCRRALRPIRLMAASARSIGRVANPEFLLEVPATRDELEDLGQSFNALLVDLLKSLERQQRFAGDASHQLRTPLTAMLSSVEVALRHERSPAEYRRVLDVVIRRGGQLRQIIESLLFLARSEGSTPLSASEQVDINDWCKTWLEVWANHPRTDDIRFRASSSPALVATHPALLGQVMDNLLDNACKYSEPGTPINVEIESSSEEVCILVKDGGCGIPEDQLAMIFDPFFRTEEARWKGKNGVGLGLAVAQRLVAIIGVKMDVLSKPGKGSEFRIRLFTTEESPASQDTKNGEFAASSQAGQ